MLMIYTIIVFALLSVGFVFLIKPQKDNTLTMKKQSLAENKKSALLSKRSRFIVFQKHVRLPCAMGRYY